MKTERERIIELRAAVVRAIRELHSRGGERFISGLPRNWEGATDFAANLYPLPKITRPRVEKDPHAPVKWKWRVVNEVPQWSCAFDDNRWNNWRVDSFRNMSDDDRPSACDYISIATYDRLALIVSLMVSPTETVEDDGSASSQGEE